MVCGCMLILWGSESMDFILLAATSSKQRMRSSARYMLARSPPSWNTGVLNEAKYEANGPSPRSVDRAFSVILILKRRVVD